MEAEESKVGTGGHVDMEWTKAKRTRASVNEGYLENGQGMDMGDY